MIEVAHISKVFEGGTFALSDVSFHINDGEIIYVLGASGSGKSSLLKIIAGLIDPDTGTVMVDDEKITGPSHNLVPGYDFIAHVSQDFKLQPYLRIHENIARKIPYLTDAEKEERIRELLALCGLGDKFDSYPPELSGGEQQRICLAANLAHEPEVILLDEPFSNLDIPHKRKLRHQIIGILKSVGTTAMIISHDPHEAMAAADRIMILEKGKLIQFDATDIIYNQPVSAYAASFLGHVNRINVNGTPRLTRPEHFTIDPKGTHQGKVLRCWFQGHHYHVYLKADICNEELLIYSPIPYKEGSSVNFVI